MSASAAIVVVMAKECVPGRVKTRLHPPLTLEQAAHVAAASLADTIDAAVASGLAVVVCADGDVPVPAGVGSFAQVDGGLDQRIAAAFDQVEGPVLLIGMDTPQADPSVLRALAVGWSDDVDAYFGAAPDGGFWLLGLADLPEGRRGGQTRGDLVRGVPMSSAETGRAQRARLVAAGLRVVDIDSLTDIDDLASLREVSARLPEDGHLAQLLPELGLAGVSVDAGPGCSGS